MEDINFIEKFEENQVFGDLGYCSTSFDINVAERIFKKNNGWLMEIYSLKNTKGTYLGEYSLFNEFEYILPRNSLFFISEINDNNKKFIAYNIKDIIQI